MEKAIQKEGNISELLRPYQNKWVALSPDRKDVLSSGETLNETASKLTESQSEEVAFMKVLPLDAYYIPFHHEV